MLALSSLERLLDRVALGDGEVALVWQFGGSKRRPVPVLARKRPLFSGRLIRQGGGSCKAPMERMNGWPSDAALQRMVDRPASRRSPRPVYSRPRSAF